MSTCDKVVASHELGPLPQSLTANVFLILSGVCGMECTSSSSDRPREPVRAFSRVPSTLALLGNTWHAPERSPAVPGLGRRSFSLIEMHMRQGSAPRLREFTPAPVFHKHDSVLGAHAVVRDLEAMGGLISSSHSLSRLPSAPPRSSSSEPPPQPREAAAVEGPKQEPPPAEAFCTRPHAIGAASGLLLFGWLQFVELSAEQPLANEMLAVVALVAVFWMFEVLPLPVTSLLPMLLIPAFGILDHSLVASAYWGPVQMMFVGAFIVDVGIEHVMLHQRLALNILLRTGVERPFVVVASFSAISFCFSSVCSNTATVVMLVPFATGLLDTSAEQARARGEEHQAASLHAGGAARHVHVHDTSVTRPVGREPAAGSAARHRVRGKRRRHRHARRHATKRRPCRTALAAR